MATAFLLATSGIKQYLPGKSSRCIPTTQAIWARLARVPTREILNRNSHQLAREFRNYVMLIDDFIDAEKLTPRDALFHPAVFSARGVYDAIARTHSEATARELSRVFAEGRQKLIEGVSNAKPESYSETVKHRDATTGEYAALYARLMNCAHGVKKPGLEERFRRFALAAQYVDDFSDAYQDLAQGAPNLFTSLLKENPREMQAFRSARRKLTQRELKRAAPKTFARYLEDYRKLANLTTAGEGKLLKPFLAGASLLTFTFGVPLKQTREIYGKLKSEAKK